MAIKDLGNGKFRIDLRVGGRKGTRHRATIEATREQAREAHRDLLQSARAVTEKGGRGATLRDAFVHVSVHHFHDLKDKAGVQDRWRVLTQLVDEHAQLVDVDSAAIAKLLTDLRARKFKGKHLTATTINKYLSLLRVLFEGASTAKPALIEADAIPHIPHLKERQHKRRPLKATEEQRVLAWLASQGDAGKWGEFLDFVVFSLDEGTRSGETRRLERVDVNLGAGKFGEVRIRDPKNGEERHVPLTLRARQVVDRRLEGAPKPDSLLFPGMTKAVLQNRWQEVQDALGDVHDVVIHSLRHTAGKRLIDLTGNLRVAQKWLGHKRIETTVRYTDVDAAALHRAAEVVSGGESAVTTPSQPDAD
jgi:integrase